MSGETLRSLILDRKGTRSFEKLSKDCGGTPSANRLHALTSGEMKNFPDPDSIRGLSRGLNVSLTGIIMASARSLGLPVSDNDPNELVLQGAGALPLDSQELLVSMSRQLQHAYSQPWGESQDDVELAASAGDPRVNPEEDLP